MHVLRNTQFMFRTLRLFLPNNRYRRLKRFCDPNYDHGRDKHPVRNKHHGTEGWMKSTPKDGITYRDYENYDEYVTHQRQKILEIIKAQGGFGLKVILRQRYDFWKRFRDLELPCDARILCLGARFGTEVEVLRDLGYINAQGTDLEPGPENPYVVTGDFMAIDAETSSVDMIYSNAVDHAFDLRKFLAEHARVLKPQGLAIYDISMIPPGPFEAVDWGEARNLYIMMLEPFADIENVTIDGSWKTIRLRGKSAKSVTKPNAAGYGQHASGTTA